MNENESSSNSIGEEKTTPVSPWQEDGPTATAQPSPEASARQAYQPQGYPQQPVIPQVIVQMPLQKKSVARWLVPLVLVVFLLLCCGGVVASCTSIFGGTDVVTTGDTIAVIHVSSEIAGTGSSYTTPESFLESLSAADENPDVKAIVIRVDCPGGTVAASQEIASYVAAAEKPIIISCSDTCASGAYMFSSQADYIMAMPGSSVGSIGVIMTYSNYVELLDKLGITIDSITSADEKDAGSPYRDMTDEERAAFQAEVDELNEQFIDTVAEGRGMDHDTVAELATGATYTGTVALDNGLIDGLGNYSDALDKAAELGGIDSDDYSVVSFDTESSGSLIDALFSSVSSSSTLSAADLIAVLEEGSETEISAE